MSANPTLPPNAFIDHVAPPSCTELAGALGPALSAWDHLLSQLAEDFGVNNHEWKCHSLKWGWSYRVKRGKRTIVWLSPANGAFIVTFVLGDKAVAAAQTAKLPPRQLKLINEATKYPEGRVVPLVVKTERNLAAARRLAAIKVAH